MGRKSFFFFYRSFRCTRTAANLYSSYSFFSFGLLCFSFPSPFGPAHPAHSKVNFGSADSSQIDHMFNTFKILKQSPAYSAAMASDSGLDMTDLATVRWIVVVIAARGKVFYQCGWDRGGFGRHAYNNGSLLTLLFLLLLLLFLSIIPSFSSSSTSFYSRADLYLTSENRKARSWPTPWVSSPTWPLTCGGGWPPPMPRKAVSIARCSNSCRKETKLPWPLPRG